MDKATIDTKINELRKLSEQLHIYEQAKAQRHELAKAATVHTMHVTVGFLTMEKRFDSVTIALNLNLAELLDLADKSIVRMGAKIIKAGGTID